MPKTYQHLFFDLDHTIWDFDKNSELTLRQVTVQATRRQSAVEADSRAVASPVLST